jgi:hypothetical protein
MLYLVAIGISLAALAISAASLYWGHLRGRRDLYLVSTDHAKTSIGCRFAMVNAGRTQILLTRAWCTLAGAQEGVANVIAPQPCGHVGDPLTIPPQSSLSLEFEFPEPLAGHIVRAGTPSVREPEATVYTHRVRIELAWVEMSGDSHSATIDYSDVTISENGIFCTSSPLLKSARLQ